MFTKIMKYYAFLNNRHQIETVSNPEWTQIEEGIRRMDGGAFNCVTLARDVDAEYAMVHTMTVGGGLNGQFTCSASGDRRDDVYNLIDDARETGTVVALPIGLHCFDVPSREIVTLDVALEAARAFAAYGLRQAKSTWERIDNAAS